MRCFLLIHRLYGRCRRKRPSLVRGDTPRNAPLKTPTEQ